MLSVMRVFRLRLREFMSGRFHAHFLRMSCGKKSRARESRHHLVHNRVHVRLRLFLGVVPTHLNMTHTDSITMRKTHFTNQHGMERASSSSSCSVSLMSYTCSRQRCQHSGGLVEIHITQTSMCHSAGLRLQHLCLSAFLKNSCAACIC